MQFSEMFELANQLQEERQAWHFHMLDKICRYNDNAKQFLIILEVQKTSKVASSQFVEKPLREARKLAELCYGNDFLENHDEHDANPSFDKILKRVEDYTRNEISWHHHHFPPACILSEHKEHHCIVLEDPVTEELLVAIYDSKPASDLAAIESLFFKDLSTT